MNLITYESADFYPLLEQEAPEVFKTASDEQGLITGFAERGVLLRHPANNLGTVVLNPVGLRIGTVFSLRGIRWPEDREIVHRQARTIIEDPDQASAQWRAAHSVHVKGMQAELALRETIIEDEPVLLEMAPKVEEKTPKILVGNSKLLEIMQRTNGDTALQLEQLVFDILRYLVLERRMSYAHLYRISR